MFQVKNFIWRACNESLPTKLNMFKRKVTNNAICEVCEAEMEDTVHAIWGCQRVKEIWWEDGFCKPHISVRFASFKDFFLGFVKAGDSTIVDRLAMVCWGIWLKRNAAPRYTLILLQDCMNFIWLIANSMVQPVVISRPNQWFPPQPPFYKVRCSVSGLFQGRDWGCH